MSEEKSERITVLIDPNLKKKLKENAETYGLNLSGYIRMVLIQNLEKEQKKA